MNVNTILSQKEVKLITYKDVITISNGLLKLLNTAKYDTTDFAPHFILQNRLEGHFITTFELQQVFNVFLVFIKATAMSLPQTKQKLATIATLKYMYNIIKKGI